jgi:radical SAM protein with 4Fe4S-binding SPASM domain
LSVSNAKVKPSFDANRQVLGTVLPLSAPFTLIIDSGDICNFRCSYCFRGNPAGFDCGPFNKNSRMGWETFLCVADQITGFPQPPKTISLSCHGEPLCNPLLPKMVAHIKKLGTSAKTSIHTNASLLDKKTAQALVDAGLDRMVVSLQGMCAEDYRKTCGVSLDYERLLERLRYFYTIKTNTEVCIKIVDVALSRPEQEFYDVFSQVADRVFVEKVVPIWEEVHIEDEAVNKYGEKYKVIDCCPLLFHTLVVTCPGDILPCTRLNPPFTMGSIFETTLTDSWSGHKRNEFLKKMLALGRAACGVCSGCYIPQNSVYGHEDIIDDYRDEILERLTVNGITLDK